MAKAAYALEPIFINGEEIRPGERRIITIPLPSLYGCSPVAMPVHVARGRLPGPCLCVTAGIHGDELNGVETVRRLLMRKGHRNLAGTIIAVPVVNIYAFLYQDRYLMDRRDLNRSFPGSPTGSLAARLAHLVTTELITKADYSIDLHSGSLHRANLPQVRISGGTAEEDGLAEAFGAPVTLIAKERDGSIRSVARSKGVHSILYEGGEPHRLDEVTIRIGLQGVINVMRKLGIMPAQKRLKQRVVRSSFVAKSSFWIRSKQSGLFRSSRNLGKMVKKGDVIGAVGNPVGTENFEVRAPHSGIIIGLNRLPVVHEGQALFNIACFEDPKDVEEELEDYQTQFGLSGYFDLQIHPEIL